MFYSQFKRDMDRFMNKDVTTSKEYNEFKGKVKDFKSRLLNIENVMFLLLFLSSVVVAFIFLMLLIVAVGRDIDDVLLIFLFGLFIVLSFSVKIITDTSIIYNFMVNIFGLSRIEDLDIYFKFNNLYEDSDNKVKSFKDILLNNENIKDYLSEYTSIGVNSYMMYMIDETSKSIELTEDLEDELFKKNKFLTYKEYLNFKEYINSKLYNEIKVKDLSKIIDNNIKAKEYMATMLKYRD